MTIKILPPRVAAQVAAGEVVERPASIVKELIENSIDAGATQISVSIQRGGIKEITISDNGAGIPADQVEIAFQRHATSKLETASDLLNVTTLGFRGEALPSIAAASEMTCVTRAADQDYGVQYRVTFGNPDGPPRQHGAAVGTTIKAENLFGYQPARLKFLKSRPTEAAHVQRTVARYAFAHPSIRFTYTADDKLQFQTTGADNLIGVALHVLGSDIPPQLIPVLHEKDDIKVEGYVSNTTLHRSNRNDLAIFVNGRPIQDRDLAWAIEQAYRQTLPQGRHPMAILMVTMPPPQVDVNAHPNKLEVRFQSPNRVFGVVNAAVADALSTHDVVHKPSNTSFSKPPQRSWSSGYQAADTSPPERRLPPAAAEYLGGKQAPPGGSVHDDASRPRDYAAAPNRRQPAYEQLPTHPVQVTPEPEQLENLREALPQLTAIGQSQLTYIIADGPGGLYIIDQHAAHERVIFDQVQARAAERQMASQQLLMPHQAQLDAAQHQQLADHLDLVLQHGFQVDHQEGCNWLISAMPVCLTAHRSPDPAHALQNLIDEFSAENLVQDTNRALAATIACHSAVRAGDRLHPDHMPAILQQLATTAEPHTCPHGRPTVINISRQRLEREFRRA